MKEGQTGNSLKEQELCSHEPDVGVGRCEKFPLLEFSDVDGQEVASEKDWLGLSEGRACAMGTTGQGLRGWQQEALP